MLIQSGCSGGHSRQSLQASDRNLQGVDECVDIGFVLPAPRLTRTAPRAISGATPIACSTCDGFRVGARTGGAAGHRETLAIQLADQRFAVDAGQRRNRSCWPGARRRHRRSVAPSAAKAGFQALAQRQQAAREFAQRVAPRVPPRRRSRRSPARSRSPSAGRAHVRRRRSAAAVRRACRATSAAAPLGPPALCAEMRHAHGRRPH